MRLKKNQQKKIKEKRNYAETKLKQQEYFKKWKQDNYKKLKEARRLFYEIKKKFLNVIKKD